MSASTHGGTPYYYVPAESRHPVMAAAGLFFVILGAGQWINGHDWGKYSLAVGLVWWLFTLYQWFGDAVRGWAAVVPKAVFPGCAGSPARRSVRSAVR